MSTQLSKLITCSFCGSTFDPDIQVACQSCPLNKNCSLICCPVCGFENLNYQQTGVAKLFDRISILRDKLYIYIKRKK